MQKYALILLLLTTSILSLTVLKTTHAMENATGSANRPIKPIRDVVKKNPTEEKQRKEMLSTKRQEFLQKVAVLRDTRKKQIVERLNANIPLRNEKATTRMRQVIEKLRTRLEALKAKTTTLKTEGKDTTPVDAAILIADTSLTKAEEDVTTQAAKDYTITLTTEDKLKEAISPTIKELTTDLRSTFTTLQTARKNLLLVEASLRNILPTRSTSITITAGEEQ